MPIRSRANSRALARTPLERPGSSTHRPRIRRAGRPTRPCGARRAASRHRSPIFPSARALRRPAAERSHRARLADSRETALERPDAGRSASTRPLPCPARRRCRDVQSSPPRRRDTRARRDRAERRPCHDQAARAPPAGIRPGGRGPTPPMTADARRRSPGRSRCPRVDSRTAGQSAARHRARSTASMHDIVIGPASGRRPASSGQILSGAPYRTGRYFSISHAESWVR